MDDDDGWFDKQLREYEARQKRWALFDETSGALGVVGRLGLYVLDFIIVVAIGVAVARLFGWI